MNVVGLVCDISVVALASFLVFAVSKEKKLKLFKNVIKIRHGLIKGLLLRSPVNITVEYISYKGIPYAAPPLGILRFKEPRPAIPWTGVRNATEEGNPCVQMSGNESTVIGQEDCLYLNVDVPITSRKGINGTLAVMVWFHGGNFVSGSGNSTSYMYGPDFIMEKPVILVRVNYRLNVFGFFSTLDKYAVGNAGLRDQVAALKWIKININNFGGDPNRVTIFGESAGAASVQYHMLSPMSNGLFQQAISASGSTLDRWALQRYPKLNALKLARSLCIMANRTRIIVKKLQKVPFRKLFLASFNASIMGFYTPFYAQPFSVSIEAASRKAFINESTFIRFQRGDFKKIPYLLGYNTEEGSFGYNFVKNGQVDINIYKKIPKLLIPTSLNIPTNSTVSDIVLKRIKLHYFRNTTVTAKKNWIKYMSVDLFKRGIRKSIEFLYQKMPVFFYQYSYVGSKTGGYLGGVANREALQYLFYPRMDDEFYETPQDRLTRLRTVTLWTNFAITGNPTPLTDGLLQNVTWFPVSTHFQGSFEFLNISANITFVKGVRDPDYMFNENLFKAYGNGEFFTY